MSSISLLVSINKDGVAKLMDETAYKLAPDQLERAAEWTPGTEIIVQETDNEAVEVQAAEQRRRHSCECRAI